MKSGDFSQSREDDYYRKAFGERDRHFVQRTFASGPALVSKEDIDGHRMWTIYDGKPFDASKFELVEGMWDHEHCSICWFRIEDGHTYWENDRRSTLFCDACYEAYSKLWLTWHQH